MPNRVDDYLASDIVLLGPGARRGRGTRQDLAMTLRASGLPGLGVILRQDKISPARSCPHRDPNRVVGRAKPAWAADF